MNKTFLHSTGLSVSQSIHPVVVHSVYHRHAFGLNSFSAADDFVICGDLFGARDHSITTTSRNRTIKVYKMIGNAIVLNQTHACLPVRELFTRIFRQIYQE